MLSSGVVLIKQTITRNNIEGYRHNSADESSPIRHRVYLTLLTRMEKANNTEGAYILEMINQVRLGYAKEDNVYTKLPGYAPV